MYPPPGSIERMNLYRERASRQEPLFDGMPTNMPCVSYTHEQREAINVAIRKSYRMRVRDQVAYVSLTSKIGNLCRSAPRSYEELLAFCDCTRERLDRMLDDMTIIQPGSDGLYRETH